MSSHTKRPGGARGHDARHRVWRRVAVIVLPLLTVLVVAVTLTSTARAGLAQEAGASSPSLQRFEAFYAAIMAAAEDSKLPPETGPMATDVRFDLERDLIRADAEIEILKLEVARFTGERQAAALADLMQAVAAKERRIYDQIQRLEALAGMPACVGWAEESSEPEPDEPEKAKKLRFNLTWEPEELIDDVPP